MNRSTKTSTFLIMQRNCVMTKLDFISQITNMPESQYQAMINSIDLDLIFSSEKTASSINKDRIVLDEGISIYRQKGKSKYWYARLLVTLNSGKKKETRFSTGKEDAGEAAVVASQQHLKLQGKVEEGYSIDIKGDLAFEVVAQRAIEKMQEVIDDPDENNTTFKDYISLLQNHIIPFFGRSNLKQIDVHDIDDYFSQKSIPRSKSRITMQKTAIMKVYKCAFKDKLISSDELPNMPDEIELKDPDYIIEPFSENDLVVLKNNYSSFIAASRTKKTKHYREAFQHYFSFLLSTGVRPGEEPKGIQYKDISKCLDKVSGNHYYVIRLRKGKTNTGKTGYRDIAIDATAVAAIENAAKVLMGLKTIERLDYLREEYPDKYVFKSDLYNAYPAYDRIFSRKQYLSEVESKLEHTRYVLYSTRHTFINNLLAADIPHKDVAEHCGNSIQVIEAHYQKAKIRNRAPRHIQGNIVEYKTTKGLLEGLDQLRKAGLVSG